MNPLSTRPIRWRPITVFNLLVGLLISIAALGQPAFLKEGLVAYYPFNGNANDESGNGYNGTVQGATLVVDRNSSPNKSYRFDGSTKINVGNPPTDEFDLIGDSTLSLWISAEKLQYQFPNCFIGKDVGPGTQPKWVFGLAADPNRTDVKLYFDATTPGYERELHMTEFVAFSLNKYTHLVVVKNGKNLHIFKDGAKVYSGLMKRDLVKVPANLTIGYAEAPTPFVGSVDDVRIYNRALSDTEVQALYAYESTPPDNSFITNGLVAYYPLDGDLRDYAGTNDFIAVHIQSDSPSLTSDSQYLTQKTIFSASYNNNSAVAFQNQFGTYLRTKEVPAQFKTLTSWQQSFWAKSNATDPFVGGLLLEGTHGLVNYGDTKYAGLSVSLSKNKIEIWFHSDNYGPVKFSESISGDEWHSYSIANTAGVLSLFIDGKLISVNDSRSEARRFVPSLGDPYTKNEFWIPSGGGFGGKIVLDNNIQKLTGRSFDGSLANVRIYDRALSDGEVKALYDYESTPPNTVPVFANQPQSQSLTAGNDATFCVTLKDAGNYNYQWQRNEQNVAGATLNCYTINSVTAAMDGGRYRVIVSNSAGTIISDNATLTVVTPPPPAIATQPTPKTVQEGANVSLSVVASGQGTLVYQWQFNEQNLPGATSSTLTLNAVKLNTAGRYRVLISSPFGVTISDTVTLTVNPNPPPTIVTQPLSRTPAEGTQVSLTVTATGLGSLTYQWQINNQNIPGANSSTLVLSAVRPSANGNYRVIVGNPYGTTISTEATVAVVVTDSDSDGLSDYEELLLGTNSNKSDSDGDGLSDFAEVRTHGSNPLTTDTDGDGYSDGIEVARDGNPNNRSVTPTGALAVFPAVDVEFYTLNGVKYQLEVSTDMVSWTVQGGVVVGNGGSQNHLVRASKATQFWRLKVVQ